MQVIKCKYCFLLCMCSSNLWTVGKKSSQSNSTGDDFPALPFPPLPGTFYTVLSKVQMETLWWPPSLRQRRLRKRPDSKVATTWHHVRSTRLTSTSFKSIFSRRITGMPWCDLFVKCDGDYYLERIHFEAEMWGKIKAKLDWYFFEHFLPIMCNGSL